MGGREWDHEGMRKNSLLRTGPDCDGGGFPHWASYHSIPYQVGSLYRFIVANMPLLASLAILDGE
jgi:hypothetical protein